jgi:4-hydroxythreonine-4-phosphate dehydrogenase
MGDPAGVGPEVVLKTLAHRTIRNACRPIVIGDHRVLERTKFREREWPFRLVPWEKGQCLPEGQNTIPVYSVFSVPSIKCRPGRPSKDCGEAAFRAITAAIDLVSSKTADAIATAPINKKVLRLAGYRYPGHTEILAEMTKTRECRMMLLGKRLKVVLVTVHLPLTQVARELSPKRIRVTLELTADALRTYFRIPRPRLAVAAFNPHAGEDGIFGSEEKRIILPAVKKARAQGIRAYGPLPADSVFHQAVRGDYDAVVCMYHDQGLGPLKLIHFFDGVNLTLGLPIIRTSADHGTAYDIAGKDMANETSMKEAILLAARLARQSLSQPPNGKRGNGK